MSANNAIVTAQAGLSFCNKIIQSIVGPQFDITDTLTANQESQLTTLNDSRIYVTFGRQQPWDLYETDEFTSTIATANITVSNAYVTLSANANAEISVGDTLYFKNQGLPAYYTGGANVMGFSANGLILTMNDVPDITITSATIIRTRNGFSDNAPPPAPYSPRISDVYVWDHMLGGKLVTGNDICVVAKKYDWTTGTTYTRYNSLDYDLFNRAFYVLTSTNAVYKCLDNNNDSPSTVEPSYIPSNDWKTVENTSDGYVWKYMFTLSNSDILKFLSDDYMPVRYLESSSNQPVNQWNVQEAAVDGAIENVIVVESGTDYVIPGDGPLEINIVGGGGIGATAVPLEIEIGTGRLLSCYVTNPGYGYGTNVSRTFTSTANSNVITHTGSTISLNYANSSVSGTNLNANSYITSIDNASNPKKVYLSANATANGVVGGGIILGTPRIVIENGGGTGAIGYAVLNGNTIANVITSNTGVGYVPPIEIYATGDGMDATFNIDSDQVGLNGEILGVNVVNSGNGYSNVVISIQGGFGSGAVLKAYSGPIDGHGSNPQEELGARSLMIAVSITGDEGGNLAMTLGNDFRQVALIENPIDANTNEELLATTFFQASQLFVTAGITNFQPDEIIYQGDNTANVSFSAVVQSFDASNNVVFITNPYYADGMDEPDANLPLKSATPSGNTTDAYRQYVSKVARPVKKYSGRILYVQNLTPVERANNQTEYVKVIINQ